MTVAWSLPPSLASNIAVASLDTGEYATVIENGTGGRYLPTGHLVYVSEGTIFAVPFDLEQREVTGEPIAVLEGLSQTVNFGTPQLAVADNGTLMYVPGTAFSETELVWVDRAGNPSPPIPAEPRHLLTHPAVARRPADRLRCARRRLESSTSSGAPGSS